jgi:hypothetical protein
MPCLAIFSTTSNTRYGHSAVNQLPTTKVNKRDLHAAKVTHEGSKEGVV